MNSQDTRRNYTPYLLALIIVLVTACYLIFSNSLKIGAESVRNHYITSFESENLATYNKVYSSFFDSGDRKYHVKNKVTIHIGNLEETKKLEVLRVSDVEYIIVNKDSNEDKIESWLEVPGTGVFTVDLHAGEFIIDSDRSYVLVRIPYPELENVGIDYRNVEKLLFEDDALNGSYSVGEDLARQQLGEAVLLIQKEFTSNQNYFLNAQNSAVNTIENLVKQLNPDVPDLIIEVEFF